MVEPVEQVKSPQIYNLTNRMHHFGQGFAPEISYKKRDRDLVANNPDNYKELLIRKTQMQQKFWKATNSKHNQSKYESTGQFRAQALLDSRRSANHQRRETLQNLGRAPRKAYQTYAQYSTKNLNTERTKFRE